MSILKLIELLFFGVLEIARNNALNFWLEKQISYPVPTTCCCYKYCSVSVTQAKIKSSTRTI